MNDLAQIKNALRIAYYAEIIRKHSDALAVKLADIPDNMDESRLSLLEPKVGSRLRKKYTKARKALKGD